MSVQDAARARWRADLHEYGSAAARGAGLKAQADSSAKEAVAHREYADLMTELADAKAAGNAGALVAVKNRVAAFRAAWRTNADRVGVVSDFSEPSNAELIEMGY